MPGGRGGSVESAGGRSLSGGERAGGGRGPALAKLRRVACRGRAGAGSLHIQIVSRSRIKDFLRHPRPNVSIATLTPILDKRGEGVPKSGVA